MIMLPTNSVQCHKVSDDIGVCSNLEPILLLAKCISVELGQRNKIFKISLDNVKVLSIRDLFILNPLPKSLSEIFWTSYWLTGSVMIKSLSIYSQESVQQNIKYVGTASCFR